MKELMSFHDVLIENREIKDEKCKWENINQVLLNQLQIFSCSPRKIGQFRSGFFSLYKKLYYERNMSVKSWIKDVENKKM